MYKLRLGLAYRLLCHLTLGLASVCLIQAEEPFLSALPACLPPYLAFVALAFLTEGRWALPAWGANVLGLLIAGGSTWWLLWQLDEPGWAQDVGPTAALVPNLGPVLMALTLVKLFRPRDRGHFWLLQGMGLIQVGLGCILATDPVFGFLLAAYVAAGLGCLALHQQVDGRTLGGVWQGPAPPGAGRDVYLPSGWLPRFILRWTLAVGAAALVLFLLTPRGDGSGWDAFRQFAPRREGPLPTAAQTGFEVGMNLNRVGEVEVEDEVALSVRATGADGQPKLDLPADQRWRGMVLDRYENGVWTSWLVMPRTQLNFTPEPRRLPDFGKGQWYLDFTVEPRRAGGLFLAEPVRLGPRRSPLPVRSLDPRSGSELPLFQQLWGTVVPMPGGRLELCHYRQVVPAGGNAGRNPARVLEPWYSQRLLMQDLPGLGKWTNQLLHRLAADPRYGLKQTALPAPGEAPDPPDWEKVARALSDYLAQSGDYTYSLDLYRQDADLDPVLDFLWNVKQGHCERFAAALTLMLRSVGIPARVVKGFRGADSQGDGTYTVRQSHAHAWVEAMLLPRGRASQFTEWIMLDPTPSAGPLPERGRNSLARWWESARRNMRLWWRDLILGYNSSFQADLLAHLGGPAGLRRLVARAQVGLLVLLGLAGLAWAARQLRHLRRPVANRPRFPWYARLLALLERHGLGPRPSQTPREFGAAARQALLALPAAAPLADVPAVVAELLYRAAFGGRPLAADEGHALDSQLDRLEAALRVAP